VHDGLVADAFANALGGYGSGSRSGLRQGDGEDFSGVFGGMSVSLKVVRKTFATTRIRASPVR